MQEMCLPNMRSWFSGSCFFTVTSSDYWAFGCPMWMPLFQRRGLEGMSLTLSPLLCPGAEEFVVVILKMLAGQETGFPPCANDVFSHVPTICSFCCAVACLKAVGQAGFSLPSPGHSNRWRSWVVTLLHHCLDCLCTGSGLCQDNFLASFGLDQTQKIGLQTLT